MNDDWEFPKFTPLAIIFVISLLLVAIVGLIFIVPAGPPL